MFLVLCRQLGCVIFCWLISGLFVYWCCSLGFCVINLFDSFLLLIFAVIGSSASDCLEKLILEMSSSVSSGL